MRTAASRSSSSTAAGSVFGKPFLALLLPLAAGCGEETLAPAGEASPRFAALSRLILFRPASGEPRPFFLDRFESTRGDFEAASASRGQAVAPILRELWAEGRRAGTEEWPAVGMTMREALEHAAWRFGRLPTWREWQYAVGGDSNPPYTFPWGDHFEDFRSNTLSLGLLSPTAVGTFEPGRYASGADSCYDLVGNVAELTVEPFVLEPRPPPPGPARGFGGLLAAFLRINRELANELALATGRLAAFWEAEELPRPDELEPRPPPPGPMRGFGGLLAAFLRINRELGNELALATGSLEAFWEVEELPRRHQLDRDVDGQRPRPPERGPGVHAVGWHFMARVPDDRSDLQRQWEHSETERSTYVGMRVATDAETLISALFACEDPLGPGDERLLERFVARHREVLAEVVARRPAGQATGAVERLVRKALR